MRTIVDLRTFAGAAVVAISVPACEYVLWRGRLFGRHPQVPEERRELSNPGSTLLLAGGVIYFATDADRVIHFAAPEDEQ